MESCTLYEKHLNSRAHRGDYFDFFPALDFLAVFLPGAGFDFFAAGFVLDLRFCADFPADFLTVLLEFPFACWLFLPGFGCAVGFFAATALASGRDFAAEVRAGSVLFTV